MQNKRGLTTWYLVQKITKAYFLIFEEQKNNKVIHMLIYDKKKMHIVDYKLKLDMIKLILLALVNTK